MLHIDTTLVEKFSDEEMVVLSGGFEVREVMVEGDGSDVWCPKKNNKNCKCNKDCPSTVVR